MILSFNFLLYINKNGFFFISKLFGKIEEFLIFFHFWFDQNLLKFCPKENDWKRKKISSSSRRGVKIWFYLVKLRSLRILEEMKSKFSEILSVNSHNFCEKKNWEIQSWEKNIFKKLFIFRIWRGKNFHEIFRKKILSLFIKEAWILWFDQLTFFMNKTFFTNGHHGKYEHKISEA